MDHNIVQKAKEAKHNYDTDKTEKLDKLITARMLQAKSKCRNGLRLPWSKEINEVMTKFNILKIHLSSLCNSIDCSAQIEKKERLLAKKITLPLTITDTVIALKKARQEVRICWKEFQLRRTTLLEDQEEAFIASNPNMDPEKAIKIFNNAKSANNIFLELPKQKHKGRGLTTIDVPVPRTGLILEYQTITDPKLIEQIILRRKKQITLPTGRIYSIGKPRNN